MRVAIVDSLDKLGNQNTDDAAIWLVWRIQNYSEFNCSLSIIPSQNLLLFIQCVNYELLWVLKDMWRSENPIKTLNRTALTCILIAFNEHIFISPR